jgi:transmembrane sensor
MDEAFEIDPILIKYVREEPLTAEEDAMLREWIAGAADRASLLKRFRNNPDWVKTNLQRLDEIHEVHIWEKLEALFRADGVWMDLEITVKTPVVPADRPRGDRWWRYAIAVCVLTATAGITYLFRANHPPAAVIGAPATSPDVQPGGDKATLTLADGHIITLDSTANGILTNQGNTQIAKQNGELAYHATPSEKPMPLTFNVLTTPKAGQFTLSLPDGTRVWLNNASSLRYPVWFGGDSREVELSGEAYFEVAKDATHPFRVHIHNSSAGTEGGTIEVLGTSFNIMAYADENAERATLVDGSIRYAHGKSSTLLKSDDQSVLDTKGDLQTLHHVNVEEIIAWKNGYFHFDHTSLETTMRQLSRWYDVSVVYQGKIAPQEFIGKIQRNMPLSTVLNGLEGEHVHFLLAGKQVTVTP